jgi:hypothetical protein
MSAFAVMVDPKQKAGAEQEFSQFVRLVAGFKSLKESVRYANGKHCCGAKMDSSSSLHKGITVDPETGSWLIATGTVIDTEDVSPDGNLRRLLSDYLTQGECVFERCDGVFALAVYNGLDQSLAAVSDPFGYFSVFYGIRNGRVFVSTSALAVARQVRSEPSDIGVNCFLRTGKVFGNMTLWQGVKRMSAATVLKFDGGAMSVSTYWRPAVDESVSKLAFADALEVSTQVLESVLKRNLMREGKLWADLTGGFDTRFLTMLLERVGIPFRANFVGPQKHPDVRIAQAIVNKLGWEYQHFELPKTWPQECPHRLQEALGRGDAHLNIFLATRPLWVHRQEGEYYPTLLSGLGGELWRGPIWWPERASLGQSHVVHYDRQLWSLMHPVLNSVFVSDSTERVRNEIQEQFRIVGDSYADAPNTVKLDCLWLYRETAHVGAWASIAAGLVRIIPVLFSRDIVSHVISLDYRWKARNQLVRHMLAKYKPTLANMEVEGRGPAVPERITNFYRFLPSKISFYRRAANKLSQVALGKSLWSTRYDEGYCRGERRREILRFSQADRLFHPAEMRSGKLYNPNQLQSFLVQAQTDGFKYDEFLGRIVTVEMAMRAVETAMN